MVVPFWIGHKARAYTNNSAALLCNSATIIGHVLATKRGVVTGSIASTIRFRGAEDAVADIGQMLRPTGGHGSAERLH